MLSIKNHRYINKVAVPYKRERGYKIINENNIFLEYL